MRMNQRHAAASALMALALLAGCSDVNELLGNDESVDYKSTRKGEPLSIPPDLTQASSDPRYRAPASGSTTYSQYQQQGQEQVASASQTSNVLPQRSDMHVERSEEHTSELQSLMRISYAVFCLNKKKTTR